MRLPIVLRRNTGFSCFAIALLTFSVGATQSVFTVVNALWFRSISVADPDRVVLLLSQATGPQQYDSVTFAGLEDQPDNWTAFKGVAGQLMSAGPFAGLKPTLQFDEGGGEVEPLGVTSGYFRVLGLAIRGRDFTRNDNVNGAEAVAIISDGLWTRAFGRRPDLIGNVVGARPSSVRIIGVAPAGFGGIRRGERVDLWIPLNLVPRLAPAGALSLQPEVLRALTFGRLHDKDTPASAKQRFVSDASDESVRDARQEVQLVPLRRVFGTPDSRSVIIRERETAAVVASSAALVILGGCATLMALVLVHYERRRHELSVRAALGASRARAAVQLLGELAWLSALGSIGAIACSYLFLRSLPAVTLPGGVELGRLDLAVDWRVTAVAGLTSAGTILLAAFWPILRFTRPGLATELAAPSSTAPVSSQRLRQSLVGLQAAVTVIVLILCGVFIRAVISGFRDGPGFDIENTLYLKVQVVSPFASREPDPSARRARTEERTKRLVEGLRSLPSVRGVALGTAPIGADQARLVLVPTQIETPAERRQLNIGFLSGSADLLQILGAPIIRGRGLTPADVDVNLHPAVLTESLARTLWSSADPLGQRLSVGPRKYACVVVGVARDFAYGTLTQKSAGVIITAASANLGIEPPFIVNSSNPDGLVEPIRKLVRDLLPDAPRPVVMTGRELVARDLGRERLGAWFFAGFGLVALLLGSGGLFGLVSYVIDSKRREFGVRLALGSTPQDLVWRAALAGLVPAGLGTVLGLVTLTMASGWFLKGFPTLGVFDATIWSGVTAIMVGSATAAVVAGAWRTRTISPSEAFKTH